jgi:hypothetical protein
MVKIPPRNPHRRTDKKKLKSQSNWWFEYEAEVLAITSQYLAEIIYCVQILGKFLVSYEYN